MTKKALIIVLMALNSWLPWTSEVKVLLTESRSQVIFTGEASPFRGLCCMEDRANIAINSNAAVEDWPMITLHETQHILAYILWPDLPSWAGFEAAAIACAKEVQPQRMRGVYKFADMNVYELHAQLPWLLNGKLCPTLQPWYPWFDLTPTSKVKSRVAAPQEDTSWAVLDGDRIGIIEDP